MIINYYLFLFYNMDPVSWSAMGSSIISSIICCCCLISCIIIGTLILVKGTEWFNNTLNFGATESFKGGLLDESEKLYKKKCQAQELNRTGQMLSGSGCLCNFKRR